MTIKPGQTWQTKSGRETQEQNVIVVDVDEKTGFVNCITTSGIPMRIHVRELEKPITTSHNEMQPRSATLTCTICGKTKKTSEMICVVINNNTGICMSCYDAGHHSAANKQTQQNCLPEQH